MIDTDAAREESLNRIRAAILPTIQRDYPHLLERGPAAVSTNGDTSHLTTNADILAGLTPIDWTELLTGERPPPDWLCEPILEAGKQAALFAEAKAGKSLIVMEACLGIASGRGVLGNPAREPRSVVYLDLENTLDDIAERVTRFGYAADELARLHYYAFPSLGWLNTADGGAKVDALARHHDASLVVVDTLSRVVDGDENDAETYHAFYRYTGLPLKARGVALIRLDHAGKDASRGMRGSSAKTSDVDAVWALTADEDQLTLVRTHTRNAHGADRMVLTREEEPLRHTVLGGDAPVADPVVQWTATLDLLGVPQSAGRDRCKAALGEAGYAIGNTLLAQVVKARKSGAADVEVMLDDAEDRLTERDKPVPEARDRSAHASPDETCPGQSGTVGDSLTFPQVRPVPRVGDRSGTGTSHGASANLSPTLQPPRVAVRDSVQHPGQPEGENEPSVTEIYGGFRVVEGPESVEAGILRAAGLLDCQVDGQETGA